MPNIVYSQHEEQRIIETILSSVPITKIAVEVGINTGAKGNSTVLQGNTVSLKQHGWKCLWIDAKTNHPEVVKKKIFDGNINTVLDQEFGDKQIGIFSIDIDSDDWHVTRAVLQEGRRPDMFICETNSYLDPMQDLVMPRGHRKLQHKKSICHGATLNAFYNLFKKFNYNFYCTTKLGTNSFWLKQDLFASSVDISLYKNNTHPRSTNWSRDLPTDKWTSSKILLGYNNY